MQGIYRILNLVNDKWYIGSASDIGKRWKDHKRDLRNNRNSPHLQSAFNKYGAKNFILEILEEVKGDRQNAFDKEQEYLNEWMPTGQLYNIAHGANGGHTLPEGWTHPEESRAKIRKGHMGIPLSAEHKVTLSKVHTGKKLTTEHKKNISIALTGREVSEETRAKLSKVNMGHEVSEETRYKIGIISAKPYPAFYNIRTGEFIPAGVNLIKMCRERNLNDGPMSSLRRKKIIKTRNDWRIATENEIHKENTIKESIREKSAT